MSNHIHLLLEPLNNNLAHGIHRFTMRYTQYFNRRYQKHGYVFQGRFRAILVDDGCYIQRVARYIHLNPLEAGIVNNPKDYEWSSYNAYFARSNYAWLETERVLSYFSTTRSIALAKFAEFMALKEDFTKDSEEIQKAVRSGIYGSEEFSKAFVTAMYSEKTTTNETCSIETLMKALCERFNITTKQLQSSEKTRQIVDARATFARTAQLLPGLSLGDISRILGKHHGTISRLSLKATKCPKLQAIAKELASSFS